MLNEKSCSSPYDEWNVKLAGFGLSSTPEVFPAVARSFVGGCFPLRLAYDWISLNGLLLFWFLYSICPITGMPGPMVIPYQCTIQSPLVRFMRGMTKITRVN